MTRSDGKQLTLEERINNVVIMVIQRNSTEYKSRWNSRDEEVEAVQIINYTLPQNGIFKTEFPILDNSTQLQLKVPSVFYHYVTAVAS